MKVFISWSGERSKKVAEALREWLPDVIQSVEPFLSSHDIPKGTRWGLEVARELEGTSIGIICLTPENLDSKWVLFEAGALAKLVAQARVCTYLFGLTPDQVLSPLADFQATKAEMGDTERLLASINDALGPERLPPTKLKKAFERWWGLLDERLKAIPTTHEPPKIPSQEDMLQEIFRFIRSSRQPAIASNTEFLDLMTRGRLQHIAIDYVSKIPNEGFAEGALPTLVAEIERRLRDSGCEYVSRADILKALRDAKYTLAVASKMLRSLPNDDGSGPPPDLDDAPF